MTPNFNKTNFIGFCNQLGATGILASTKGEIKDLSKTAKIAFGIKKLSSEHLENLFLDKEQFSIFMEKSLGHAGATNYPTELRNRQNNETIWADLSSSKITSELEEPNLAIIAIDKSIPRFYKKSEAIFRRILNELPVGYHESSADATLKFINKYEFNLLGYRPGELKGEEVFRLLCDEDIEGAKTLFHDKVHLIIRPPRNLFRNYRKKNGTTVPVIVNSYPVISRTGKEPKVVEMRTVIQSRGTEPLFNTRNLGADLKINELNVCAFRKNLSGNFTFMNLRLRKLLGINFDQDITDYSDDLFFPPELAAKYKRDDQSVLSSGKYIDRIEKFQPKHSAEIEI